MHFLVLNALAAILWSILFSLIGFALAGPLGRYFHHPKSVVPLLVGGLLLFGGVAFLGSVGWKATRSRG